MKNLLICLFAAVNVMLFAAEGSVVKKIKFNHKDLPVSGKIKPNVAASVDMAAGQNGSGARKITFKDKKKDFLNFALYYKVAPGNTYIFTVYAKSDLPETSNILLALHTRDAKKNLVKAKVPAQVKSVRRSALLHREWTKMEIAVSIPANDPEWAKVDQLLFHYGAQSAGKEGYVMFRDLTIETGKEPLGNPILKQSFDYTPNPTWVVRKKGSKCSHSIVFSEGRTEKGCRVLDFKGEEKESVSVPQYVNVRHGKRYSFSVFVKAEETGDDDTINLSVQTRDAKGRQLPPPTPLVVGKTSQKALRFGEWKRITLECFIPANDAKWAKVGRLLFLYGASSAGGKVYFDDIEVHELDK